MPRPTPSPWWSRLRDECCDLLAYATSLTGPDLEERDRWIARCHLLKPGGEIASTIAYLDGVGDALGYTLLELVHEVEDELAT